MTQPPPKKSDLGVRVLSAIVMVAVAGTALWLGGWFWTLFVAAVGLGVLWEWWGLVRGFVQNATGRTAWLIGGLVYIGTAVVTLVVLRGEPEGGWAGLIIIVLGVIGTDVGAYFAGRTIGGPKIAPSISPSKTWSGLVGGMMGAALGIWTSFNITLSDRFIELMNAGLQSQYPELILSSDDMSFPAPAGFFLLGCFVALVAQFGDFFESWMKRKAGVKDSGNLIPGHGGLFDRADGLIAVAFVSGFLNLGMFRYIL